MQIKPFLPKDVEAVKKFTDKEIGDGYYSLAELKKNQQKSIAADGTVCSFLLVDDSTEKVHGLRLAFPAGNWHHGKGSQQRPDLCLSRWIKPLIFRVCF